MAAISVSSWRISVSRGDRGLPSGSAARACFHTCRCLHRSSNRWRSDPSHQAPMAHSAACRRVVGEMPLSEWWRMRSGPLDDISSRIDRAAKVGTIRHRTPVYGKARNGKPLSLADAIDSGRHRRDRVADAMAAAGSRAARRSACMGLPWRRGFSSATQSGGAALLRSCRH